MMKNFALPRALNRSLRAFAIVPTLLFLPFFATRASPASGPPGPVPRLAQPFAFGGTVLDDFHPLRVPAVGDYRLRIISPSVLELTMITTKDPDPAPLTSLDLVTADDQFLALAAHDFFVTVAGQPVMVSAVGFRRRVRYAPVARRDLRIGNYLYLVLARPISASGPPARVTVANPTGGLWTPGRQFSATADALRYSPAIHVNQEGYVPSLPKKAMIGYYLGSLGELKVPAGAGFELVDAVTGAVVYQGALTPRPDVGYTYSPAPYQDVLQADFSRFTTPGKYRLAVPGLGASFPFFIDDGIVMGFLRTYELGLYHQRSGTTNAMPYTRFVHDGGHTAPAEVPSPQSRYAFTWTTIASKNADYRSTDPADVGPQLNSEAAQLYPFVNQGPIDVSGGHFDGGDYSKYTINSAALVHYLMFAVDNIPGAAALDNLGIPESGDGISDLMQEAKWEADYIAKLQDADGGFYFLVYPKDREYESNVLPDHGDPQVVWPKNTACTAAAVAALAQCASSPLFKRTYPVAAARYLQKARLGWQFLMNAIAKYGKDGSYQKITFYGDDWIHDDELAWAACELYLATGDPVYQQALFDWFPDPGDPSTFRWGWWRMAESWGCAIRDYAFAARSGRLAARRLDLAYLAKCETQIVAAGDDALQWSRDNAYASSFPEETKRFLGGGWYFSLDQASDMAVAYLLDPKPAYLDALVGNLNYVGGCNPVNVCFVTGLGLKRQREIVDQYAQNDRRVLPPDGLPIGNIRASFDYLQLYKLELRRLTFPSGTARHAPYPFYDRWSDTYNVSTEFISVNIARALTALALLASKTPAVESAPWTHGAAQIALPAATVPLHQPLTFRLHAPGFDLTKARIVWEARDQQPAFGATYTISPVTNGGQWVEAEAEWPDGRRVFATGNFEADSPVVTWMDGALPKGATPGAGGGDAWSWVTAAPPAQGAEHRSAAAAGLHEHWFLAATDTLAVNPGDALFVNVCLDPAHPPSEVMVEWNDGSWEHRAFWGENISTYGANGTAGRHDMGPLPPAGRWVQLEVPARAVGLEGRVVSGMGFTLYNGGATWGAAGKVAAGHSPPAPPPTGGK